MTLDQQRRAGFIELAPCAEGFAARWHVGQTITVVAEGNDFIAVADRAAIWAADEGIPLVRGMAS
jgi:hypothetical protein